jgi:hypothetical protein
MCCAIIAKEGLVKRVNSFITKENGEVNIVAIVVLIGIAVILAVVFRKGIEKILKSLFSTIETNANDAITA